MSKKLIAVAVALASMSAINARADIFDSSMFSVKGFGTAGIVHSSEDKADFVGTPFQPSGAGFTHEWDAGVDSKLGLQLDGHFGDKFSAVVQAVSQHQYDDTWRPMIEWANVKYQVTSDFSVRAGRVVLPAFLISDSRMVGYANPWIRPPVEVYSNSPITNSDGGDFSYHLQLGNVANTVQAFYGNTVAHVGDTDLKGRPVWGINDTAEIDALTLRVGYVSEKIDFESDSIQPLYDDFINKLAVDAANQNYPQAAAQAAALGDKFDLNNMHLQILTVGANYDAGDWFAMGEYAKLIGDSIVASSKSFYVTSGYRLDTVTPYVTFAQTKTDKTQYTPVDANGLPSNLQGLAGGANAGVSILTTRTLASQRTGSVGVRWDFMRSADFKLQYDHITLLDDTTGRLLIPITGSYTGSDHINVVSAAIDFVF